MNKEDDHGKADEDREVDPVDPMSEAFQVSVKKTQTNLITNMKFYRRLRGNMSQEALAELIGLSAGMIGRIEAGYNLPKLENAIKIASALGISVSLLLADPSETIYQESLTHEFVAEIQHLLKKYHRD